MNHPVAVVAVGVAVGLVVVVCRAVMRAWQGPATQPLEPEVLDALRRNAMRSVAWMTSDQEGAPALDARK